MNCKEEILCGYCGNKLTEEELDDPKRNDPSGEYIICDECHWDHYEAECQYCEEYYDTDSEYDATEPGKLIAVWNEALGYPDKLKPGYYRVLNRPFLADDMIDGWFFSDNLEFVAELDARGNHIAEYSQYLSGPLCEECQKQIRSSLLPYLSRPIHIQEKTS